MSFHEKSAWLMALILLAGGAWYFNLVLRLSAELGSTAPPLLPVVVVYVIGIVILSIIGHLLITLARPSLADDTVDERDRAIIHKAGNLSGVLLALGVLTALGTYLFTFDGNLMFHIAFGALMGAQVAEYGARIAFYRMGG